jgi:restriction endonuclease S subunit
MKFGLEQHIIDKLIAVFEQHSKVDKALVFGSRAKGNYRPDSDIDIAIKGLDLNTDDIIAMSVAFEEKGITHKIDLINYDTIKEPNLKDHIDPVGIELYSRWKKIQLGDIIDVKHGFAFIGKHITEEPTNNILVTPGNFQIGGGFKSSKLKYYNSGFPSDYILNAGDIVVTMTDLSQETDTLGYSAKIPKQDGISYLHNQRIGLVQFKSNDVNKDFIYWVLRTKEYQGFIVGSASGTSIMHTAPTRIKEYSFSLPPLKEQTAIATILSILEDKIDLLNRQNKTLEKLAETLFRQWFVEEADESWEVVRLLKLGKNYLW